MIPANIATEHTLASGIRVTRNAAAVMRDGTVLRADIYAPPDRGRYPVLLMRVPYGKDTAQSFVYQHPSFYARHGYLVVIQDCRGRFTSDGEFNPLRHEATDGCDTVDWAARLTESDGAVGMYGFSYAGATQLLAASEQPTALRCCVPAFTAADYFDGWMYERGILNLSFVMSWTLLMLAGQEAVKRGDLDAARAIHRRRSEFPAIFTEQPLDQLAILRETGVAPYFFDWLAHDTRDDYWDAIGLPGRYDQIKVPCLHIGGWYDVFCSGTVRNYRKLADLTGTAPGRQQHLMMGPWIHMPWAPEATGLGVGASFRNRVDSAQLAWFDRWLKGVVEHRGAPASASFEDAEKSVTYFVMGENEWRTARVWPPPGGSNTVMYLRSGGQANSRSGDGQLSASGPPAGEPADVFVFDPSNPVPSAGGNSCCNSAVSPMGQSCQAAVEVRNDVLVYTSGTLPTPLEVAGSPVLVLHAATTAIDTDWMARLVDVAPDGATVNVTQGALRARFKDSLSNPQLLPPNQAFEFTITMNPTAWQFAKGHRVRLQVTSSDFPAKDPNRNTGGPQTSAEPWQFTVATQIVLHDNEHPSALHLPTSEAGTARDA